MPDNERDEDVLPGIGVAERPAAEPLLGGPGPARPLVSREAGPVPAGPAFEIPNPVRRRAPGRAVGGEEAGRAMGAIDLPAEERQRAAELLGNVRTEGLVPEFSNAQAMALRARRRGPVAGPRLDPVAIARAAPAPALAAPARNPVRAPAQPQVPAVAGQPRPEPPREPPRNLPALVAGQDVALPPRAFPREAPEPRWYSVYDAPGYLQGFIREIGARTLATFPCYARHRQVELANGEDPLGTVRFLADMPGLNTAAELNQVAGWILENGLPMSPHQIAIPAIPGYEPRVVLAASEEVSYLMVDERVEDGAPGNRRYIYSWTGGTRHYLQNPAAVAALNGLRRPGAIGAPGQAPRLAEPARALPAPAVGHGGAPRQPNLPAVALVASTPPVNVDEERRRRRGRVAALPKAAPPAGAVALAKAVRQQAGFLPSVVDGRPSLVRELDDGGSVLIQPEEGKTFADTVAVVGRIVSASGSAGPETRLSTLEEVEAFAAPAEAPSPR